MVKHIVTFKLKGNPLQRHEIATAFRDALMSLPEKIDVLKDIEVGINQNSEEDWDIVLTAILEKMEDIPLYSNHPDHIAAAQIIKDYKESRACVDYQY